MVCARSEAGNMLDYRIIAALKINTLCCGIKSAGVV